MTETEKSQDLGRAKNAVQEFLRRLLLVPKIYFDAEWNGVHMDILAVDRAGVGDVHAVRLVPLTDDPNEDWRYLVTLAAISANEESKPMKKLPLIGLPMQFRYVALVCFSPRIDRFDPAPGLARSMLAENGIGRIGILTVDMSGDEPSVQVVLKAERFPTTKEIVDLTDHLVAEHTANWEVRE